MEDPNFGKSRKRKSREADNRALNKIKIDEVAAGGLVTATLAGEGSRKKRKRQSRSDLVSRAREPEGSNDADSWTLSKPADSPSDGHQRRHKHKHKRKPDFSSLSLETDAGGAHQLAGHRHRHRCHHQESSSVTETCIRPELDAQTVRKHRHKHKHKRRSQSSTADNSQEEPERHRHRHKQREPTNPVEPAVDSRMDSTLQVEGAEELSEPGGSNDADSWTLSKPVDSPSDRHQRRHKHKHKRKPDFSSLSLETDAGGAHQLAGHHQESSSVTETHIRPELDAQTVRKHRHKHKHKRRSQSSTADNSQEEPERHRHRHKQREPTNPVEPAVDGRMGSTLQVEGTEELSEQQLAQFRESEDQYCALHCQWVRSTQENRERLREKVGKWKVGRWSVQEIRILKRNVRAFLKEYGVTSLSSLIFSDRSERHAALYRYMAKDIKRPLMNIYQKMLRVFDVEHFVGRWTPEMEQKLLSLQRLHGNHWKTIGRMMGVSNAAANSKYRMLRRKRKGPWTREEEERLVEAMKHFYAQQEGGVVIDADDLPDTIRWEDVAEQVGSRTHHQCRQKWVLHLCWKQKGGHDQWTFQDDLKLIRTLVLQDEEDEEGVDWGQLCGSWPSARSASHLRGKWASLRRDVPNYRIRTFQDNLEWLLEHKAPALERQQKALEAELIETSEENS